MEEPANRPGHWSSSNVAADDEVGVDEQDGQGRLPSDDEQLSNEEPTRDDALVVLMGVSGRHANWSVS